MLLRCEHLEPPMSQLGQLGPHGPEMRLPLCTRKPTSSARQAMSEKCHEQYSQIVVLIDQNHRASVVKTLTLP